ncbi:MAG: ATP-binding protein [Coriobacteriia bacterium]|nr:ATP-binding protein [Coriobacteriia bacterium]
MNETHKESNYVTKHRQDFSVVRNPARIAVYDDLKSPPHVITIKPDLTNNYIEKLTSSIYDEIVKKGSKIPYTVIREIAENFIHASFSEIVVSVLDNGNTIRFADQGPGFKNIENSQLPGFTSATEDMKQYIRGVGSGLPTVKDYLNYSDGCLKIENNVDNGAVVTISLIENLKNSSAFSENDQTLSDKKYSQKLKLMNPNLNLRDQQILKLLLEEGALGVSEIAQLINLPLSSTHKSLKDLEQNGLVTKLDNKKRILSNQGYTIISYS